MPRIPFVPRVNADAGQSQPFAAPDVQPMRNAAGSQMQEFGQALTIAGLTAQKAGDYIDDVAAVSTYNNYNEEATKLETGYRQLQGKEAMDAYPKVVAEMEALRERFESSIDSDRQRQLFSSRANIRDADGRLRVNTYGMQQTKVAKIGSLEAGAEGSFMNYQQTLAFGRSIDPEARAEVDATAQAQLQEGLRQQKQAAELRGETPEMIDVMRRKTLDKVYLDAITPVVDNNPQEARRLLEQNRGQMSPLAIDRAEKLLQNADTNQTALDFQLKAVGIAAKRGGTMAQQQDYAEAALNASYQGKKLTADQYMRANSLIKNYYREERQQSAVRLGDARAQAEKVLSDPANLNRGVEVLDSETVRVLQEGGAWDSVIRFTNTGRYVTDPQGFNEMASMSSESLRNMSEQEYLERARNVASARGQQQLVARRRMMLGSSKDQSAAGAFLKADRYLENIAIKALDLDKETAEQRRYDVDAWVSAAQDRYGQYLTAAKLPDSEDARWEWIRKEEAKVWLTSDGEPASTFDLPVEDWKDPRVKFDGKPTRVSSLPTQITVWDAQGASKTMSREELALDARLAKGSEPTEQELADYIASRIKGSAKPAQVQSPQRQVLPDWIQMLKDHAQPDKRER